MANWDYTAILFLTIVAGSVGVWFFTKLQQSPYNVVQACLFGINILLTRLLGRASIKNEPQLQPGQGAVLIANHCSSVDPFFIQLSADRVVHWMVAKNYFTNGLTGWFLRTCEAIPTRRGGIDTASTKQAIRLASSGSLIGMFPEGRINMSDQFMLPVRPGAITIALKARIPILPVYIKGSPYGGTPWSPFFLRARVELIFGDPIDLSAYQSHKKVDRETIAQLMLQCTAEIAKLAGRDDFEPRNAGKNWNPSATELDQTVREFQQRKTPATHSDHRNS